MKEFVDIHDFLVNQSLVGDWDGEEERVAEQINEIYHTVYQLAEDDIDSAELEALLHLIWDIWIGEESLADLDNEEIYDWCQHFLDNRERYLSSEE